MESGPYKEVSSSNLRSEVLSWGGLYLEALSCKVQYCASYSCVLCESLEWLKVVELDLDDRSFDRVK